MLRLLISFCLILGLGACGSSEKKEEIVQEPMKKEEASKKDNAEAKPEMKKEPVEKATHWSYKGAFGPQFWGNLDTKYELCKSGKQQSPIDLVWKRPKKSGSLVEIAYKETALKTMDSGHSIVYPVDPGSMLMHNGKAYDLKMFHFHSPSEHSLSGKNFPLEMQLVHIAQDGQFSIVSVFFKVGAENAMLAKMWANIPAEKKQVKVDNDFLYTPSVLLPNAKTHYNYIGSLTAPPCSENVNWIVMNTPLEASKAQIDAYKALYKDNNRPAQSLGGRDYNNY
ncbi:MAG: carbonate dehydratase [Bdellovibrionaceae bacterium]|nr:carbonate dehydratase [Pseudobdellovibrionaceae bacterium]|tara:strand:+ start:9668 stop:10510 length:843 start_codon:yes stop_codon:yes gene_type:complete